MKRTYTKSPKTDKDVPSDPYDTIRKIYRDRATQHILQKIAPIEEGIKTLDWTKYGACRQVDPDAFYPEGGASAVAAKRICKDCDVQKQCLEFALANEEDYGVWGGTTRVERRRILKTR